MSKSQIEIAETAPKMPPNLSPDEQRRFLMASEQLERAKRANENTHERVNGRLTRNAMLDILKSGMSVVDARVVSRDRDKDGNIVAAYQGVSINHPSQVPSEADLVGDDEDAQNALLESINKRRQALDEEAARVGKQLANRKKTPTNTQNKASSPQPASNPSPIVQTHQNASQEQQSPSGAVSTDDLDEQMVEGHPLKFWGTKSDDEILALEGMTKTKLKSIRKAERERDAYREELEARQQEEGESK